MGNAIRAPTHADGAIQDAESRRIPGFSSYQDGAAAHHQPDCRICLTVNLSYIIDTFNCQAMMTVGEKIHRERVDRDH